MPAEPGLYCFGVACRVPGLPTVMHPLYAGETASLKRYRQYLAEREAEHGRTHMRKFLKTFDGEVEFVFAELQADEDELRAVERRFNDALTPAYSHRNLSAEVRQARAAWP